MAGFAPRHRHVMFGHHALAGDRRSPESTARWYERLQRLLPGLAFEIHAIAVTGMPWRTFATVTWNDSFALPNGSVGTNQGVHEFELRRGKVHALTVHCDTERLQRYCELMAASGVAEARAEPITDVRWAS